MRGIAALIGKPYKRGATGPDSFDCEGLARHIQRECFGKELPTVPDAIFKRRMVKRIRYPVHGSIVFTGAGNFDRHIGVYLAISGGGIIHVMEGIGVIFDSLHAFHLRCPCKARFYKLT